MIKYLLLTVVSFSQPVVLEVHDSLAWVCEEKDKKGHGLVLKIEAKSQCFLPQGQITFGTGGIISDGDAYKIASCQGGVTDISISSITCQKFRTEEWREGVILP